MITTVFRRSILDASRRNLSALSTSSNTVLFHHLTPAAATVSDLVASGPTDVALHTTRNLVGVKAKGFHSQSGPSEFRTSIMSSSGFAVPESIGNSEIVKASSSKGIEKRFPIQKTGEESTSKIKGTKICIAIRSFDNPEKQAWCFPPHSRKVAMPDTRILYTVLRSPHVDKKSREQFEMRFKKRFLVIKAQSHELSKKLFWLKRYRILGAQYELQFHCKTRLDMTPVLGNINGSTNGQ